MVSLFVKNIQQINQNKNIRLVWFLFIFCFVWFYGALHSLCHIAPKQETWFWLTLGVTNIKATSGVSQTTSPAGAKRCIISSYSNSFSGIWRSRRDKRLLQCFCLSHKKTTLSLKGFCSPYFVTINKIYEHLLIRVMKCFSH
jgi:hypothetical protein